MCIFLMLSTQVNDFFIIFIEQKNYFFKSIGFSDVTRSFEL